MIFGDRDLIGITVQSDRDLRDFFPQISPSNHDHNKQPFNSNLILLHNI